MARKTSFEQRDNGVPSGFKVPAITPGERVVKWLKENFTSVILPILAIIVLGAGIYYYSTGPTTAPAPDTQAEATTATPASDSVTTPTPALTEPTPAPAAEEPVPGVTTGLTITETAVKGDGITHLARRALKTFLASHQEYSTLTSEHKIYIEDHLKDRVGSWPLAVGETLEFSTTQIENAIAQAQRLTPAQLKNLTKYVQRVAVL